MQMGIISPAAECVLSVTAECVILYYGVCYCVSFHLLINLIFVKCCNMDSTLKWNLRESLRLEQECNSCQSCAECPKILVAINTEMEVCHDLDLACGHTHTHTHTTDLQRTLNFFCSNLSIELNFCLNYYKKKKKERELT
jgi:hypothetical protein